LDAALDSSDADIQAHALRTLTQRPGSSGKQDVLRRWHLLGDSRKELVAEPPARLGPAIREAILSSDRQLFRNACEAALWARECSLIPTLLIVAEDPAHPENPLAAQTLLALTEVLVDGLLSARHEEHLPHPQVIWRRVAPALEDSSKRYEQHRCPQVLEAFLMLAARDSAWLIHVLCHARHPALARVIELLTTSPRPSIMRLLLSYLDDPNPPALILTILTQRCDVAFVKLLTKRVAERFPDSARKGLRKVDALSWLQDGLALLSALNDREQRGALELVLAAGTRKRWGLSVIQFLLQSGAVGARRAAISRLAEFRGLEADHLIMTATADEDPQVQKRAAELLWDRALPGAVLTLVQLLQSPHEMVRAAVRRPLAAFTFQHYAAIFDTLDEQGRRETGVLVKRVDPTAIDELRMRLGENTRASRIRAIEMTVAIDAVVELELELIELLADDDYLTRVEAAHALAQTNSPASSAALRLALGDEMASVRQAAQQALKTREAFVWNPAPGIAATPGATEVQHGQH